MHPRTREVLEHLDSSHAELKRAVEAVPAGQRSARPAPDRWSVAEVVEHLARVEGRIAAAVLPALEAAAGDGFERETETSPVVPTLDLAALLDRSRPLAAGEASLPREGLDAEAAMSMLEERRETLRRALLAADGRALGTVRLPHPRIGELDLYQWLVFVGGHEARHAAQVREIAAALGSG